MAAVDLPDAAALDRDRQTAGIGTVEWTCGSHSGASPGGGWAHVGFGHRDAVYDGPVASFQQRLVGAVRLDSAVYEEVEHDASAITQAAAVVIVASLTTSVSWYFGVGGASRILWGTMQTLLAWVVGAAVLWLVGTRVLPGKQTEAGIGQLLRTVGFAQAPAAFGLLVVVPVVGLFVPFIVSLWVVAATFVAVRQALDYDDTFRAVIVCLLSWVVSAAVFMLTGLGTVWVR